tara:strand:+ start:1106 stop:1780 length:675 start_codon:yes stop_codon:yes gene_type:complete
MISWLKGKIVHSWKSSNKEGIVLNIGGIGYEIQLLPKHLGETESPEEMELWIHQINREDCTYLYGFIEVNQRDLFREIIGVNGIGPQIAMALLEDHDVIQLVNAIEDNDISLLTKSQGIGKRIAERLIVELRNKLQRFIDNNQVINHYNNDINSKEFTEYVDEIYLILNSLGYIDSEIKDSIKVITINEKENSLLLNSLSAKEKTELMDKHLKEILMKLSAKST